MLGLSRIYLFGLVVAGLLSSATFARADEPAFPKERFTLTINATYMEGLGTPDADLAGMSVGVNYYFIDNLSVGMELAGLHADQAGDDGYGGYFSLGLRHHLLDFYGTTLYADIMSGPVEWSRRVPEGGTHFNFITRTGLGLTHSLNENVDLAGGVRYFHLSNARIAGHDRNPGVDGIEFYIGLIWRL